MSSFSTEVEHDARLSPSRLVVGLEQVDKDSVCGGKAQRLAEMSQAGFRVPRGVVVTDDAFRAMLTANHLNARIRELERSISLDEPASVAAASAQIAALIQDAKLPVDLAEQIELAAKPLLAAGLVVVRSSACGEDSETSAFAGQLDSFLGIDSLDELFDALRRCWASYWSHRCLTYQLARSEKLQGMGVLVQQQVNASLAGVLFTQHVGQAGGPEVVVEYCEGLADKLVAGHVEPNRLRISGADCRVEHDAGHTTLEDGLVAKLVDAARTLEDRFGRPQDIEWVADGDGLLHLVQCRPITTVGVRDDNLSDEETVVWSNANVNENFPEPISPLLFSIASVGYYHYFRNLGTAFGIASSRIAEMEYPLRNIIGTHGGRIYYNLTNIHAVLRTAPFGKFLSQAFNQFVGAEPICSEAPALARSLPRTGARVLSDSEPGVGRSRLGEWFELSLIVAKTFRCFRRMETRLPVFEATVDDFARRSHPDRLGTLADSELLDLWRGFHDIRCHWTDAAMADAASMISYGLSQRMLAQEFPESQDAALANRLLTGLRDVVSGLPTQELWSLSRRVQEEPAFAKLLSTEESAEVWRRLQQDSELTDLRAEVERFLETWGFRCSGELMLTTPSYQERPEALLELLRAYVLRESESPEELLVEQQLRREQETDRILGVLRCRQFARWLPWPRKDWLARRLFAWTQRSIACRERARLKQALLYSRCRRIALEIGQRFAARDFLRTRDEVFMLTFEEIEALLAGGSMFPDSTSELVSLRASAYDRLPADPPPDRLQLRAGSYWNAATEEASTDLLEGDSVMRGTGVCGGQRTGRAVVLTDPSQLERVSPGDILVTRQTDPGWGPILFLVRGLVMERGGMLSHGAILAREYGIPTVVDARQATRRITTGQQIRVDGDRGLVELLD